MVKIVDGFIFYNELELLTYRLNVLNDVVDYFVIVESTRTFVGKEKSLFYKDNAYLFKKFAHKIVHVVVDDFPYLNPDAAKHEVWKNEYFQRNAIARGVRLLKDVLSESDAIIITDVDEIPDPTVLARIKRGGVGAGAGVDVDAAADMISLEMDFYYYNLHCRFDETFKVAKVLTYKKFKDLVDVQEKTCHDIRFMDCPAVPKGGWHLSYFGDKHYIQNKIKNFSHQELNHSHYTDLDKIEARMQLSKDLYDRHHTNMRYIKIQDNPYLPKDYAIYLKNFYSDI